MHVTDWLPSLVSAAGGDVRRLDPRRFGNLDGVDQWAAITGIAHTSRPPPRTELLHNIEGAAGRGVAVLRVGRYKLLHRMQTARGFDGWCDACNHTAGCWMPPSSGPGAGAAGRRVALGGQLCCYGAPPMRV